MSIAMMTKRISDDDDDDDDDDDNDEKEETTTMRMMTIKSMTEMFLINPFCKKMQDVKGWVGW